MLEIRSTGCGKYHHAEFRLRLDTGTAVERDARELVACIEREVAGGRAFKEGDLFQCGWLNLRFRKIAPDLMAAEEPDLTSIPTGYEDSVTNALGHLHWQRMCASAVGIQESLNAPVMTHMAAICPKLQREGSFFMERHTPTAEDSGWIIACDEPGHDHVHSAEMLRASLYEVVLRFRVVVAAFLALPPGSKVLKTPQGLWISCDGHSHQIRQGSFLDQLVNGAPDCESTSIVVNDSHNLLTCPAGTAVPSYHIPLARHLIAEFDNGSPLIFPAEIQALGIRQPNTALLMSKGLQWRKSWNGDSSVEFDLGESQNGTSGNGSATSAAGNNEDAIAAASSANLKPGDELILILGFSDPAPDSITKGGIAAMWSGRLKIAGA